VIPEMGTPEMQIVSRSSVIGGIPRPEARGTERREADRELFGEAIDTQNDSLIERTLEVWAPRLGCDLSGEDARQIAENMVGFFKILNEWRIREATCSIGCQPRYDWHESRTCTYHRSHAGGSAGCDCVALR
jgi:hypothetical protein